MTAVDESILKNGSYHLHVFNACNEARVLISGRIDCSGKFKENASPFEGFSPLLNDVDIAAAPLATETRGLFGRTKESSKTQEFAREAAYAGFNVLYACEEKTKKLGELSNAAFLSSETSNIAYANVNGINIAFVRVANESDISAIAKARKGGAEFVIALVAKSEISDISEKLQSAGADYIVLNNADGVGKYYPAKSDHSAPIATSLGTLAGSKPSNSASIIVTIRKSFEGNISFEDEAVPICFFGFSAKQPLVVAARGYELKVKSIIYSEQAKIVRKSLGAGIQGPKKKRRIHNKTGFKPQLSIAEIYEILGADSSAYTGKFPIDKKVKSVVFRTYELDRGCVAILRDPSAYKMKVSCITAKRAKEAGAVFAISENDEVGIPYIKVDSVVDALFKIVAVIRSKYDPYTVAITGSIGKSTTTDLIKSVFKTDRPTLDVRGNYNNYPGISFCIQKLDSSHKAYIQEVHGGAEGAAHTNSTMLRPNAAVITFIGDCHLNQIGGNGTVEDVLREKLGIIDGFSEDGVLFVNNDNEYLKNVNPPCKVIRYAAYDETADYHAADIKDFGNRLEFKIVCAEGTYDAILFMAGAHNVTNAVGAFAVGHQAGIDPYKIIIGLSRYRAEGVRQHSLSIDGVNILLDCASATPDSMKSSIAALGKMTPASGCKRVAILGNVAMLGKKSKYWHTTFGDWVIDEKIDLLIAYGDKAKYMADVVEAAGIQTIHCETEEEVANAYRTYVKPGDAVLFKASPKGGADLEPVVINLFGEKRIQ